MELDAVVAVVPWLLPCCDGEVAVVAGAAVCGGVEPACGGLVMLAPLGRFEESVAPVGIDADGSGDDAADAFTDDGPEREDEDAPDGSAGDTPERK